MLDLVCVFLAFASTALGSWVAFSARFSGSLWAWAAFAGCSAPMAAAAIMMLYRRGELRAAIIPKWGDISLSVARAFLVFVIVWALRQLLIRPGSAPEAWLLRTYLHAGDPAYLQRQWAVVLALMLLVVCTQELVWRSVVRSVLERRMGARLSIVVGAAANAAAFVPSAFLLRDSRAGLNPLIVVVAFLGAFGWITAARRSGRLVPSVMSQVMFLWLLVVQMRLSL